MEAVLRALPPENEDRRIGREDEVSIQLVVTSRRRRHARICIPWVWSAGPLGITAQAEDDRVIHVCARPYEAQQYRLSDESRPLRRIAIRSARHGLLRTIVIGTHSDSCSP